MDTFCRACNGTRSVVYHDRERPCIFCTDSATPDKDFMCCARYSAGIRADGTLVGTYDPKPRWGDAHEYVPSRCIP